MTLQAVPPFPYPNWGALFGSWTTSTSFATILIDAASEKAAYIFEVPVTGTVTDAEFRTVTVTTGCTLTISLQTVDATTGFPTGTLYNANATGTCVLTATTDNNKIINAGFGGGTAWGSFTATAGDIVALVIEQPSVGFGNVTVGGMRATTPAPTGAYSFPYTAQYVGTPAWTKTGALNIWPSMALVYSGPTYNFIHETMIPWLDVSTVTWANNSATKEYGAKIVVPMKCRVRGVMLSGKLSGSDTVVSLYDSGGTELTNSGTRDKDILLTQSGGNGDAAFTFRFAAAQTITAGSTVYVGVKPQSTISNNLDFLTVQSSARLTAMCGGGKITRVERATQSSGAWTETTTSEPRIALIIDQLDDGAGGAASLLVSRGMHGGIP